MSNQPQLSPKIQKTDGVGDKFKKLFGMSPDQELIPIAEHESLLHKGEMKVDEIKHLIAEEGKKRGGTGLKLGGVAGAGIGIATAIPTWGISLLAVPIGIKLGQWIGKRVKTSDIRELMEDLDETIKEVDYLKSLLAEANRNFEQLEEIEEKYQRKPLEAKNIFTIEDYRGLELAENSVYLEVRNKTKEILRNVYQIPGFKSEYENISGHSVDVTESIKLLLTDLNSKNPDIQILALSRLYPLEKESNIVHYSKDMYYHYLHSKSPKVQATALKMMVTAEELRPNEKEFVKILERFLASNDSELVEIALYAIYNTNYKSGYINYQLRRISDVSSPVPEKLRTICSDVFRRRIEQGNARELDGKRTTEYILQTIVGNDHLKRNLKSILHTFIGSINDISIRGPFVFIYLFGPPGTGKTTLISRLQEEINQDQYGLIRITMPEIRTLDDLIIQLQNASPLQGKTIFFDEFQALDNIKPVEEQNKVIEFLKLIFATEEDDKGIIVDDKFKSSYNLDLKGVMVAIATNIDLAALDSMANGRVGEALLSRVFNLSIPLMMNDDLKENIEEFVEKFLPYKFYKYVIKRHFEDNIHFTDRAKNQIISDLKDNTHHLPKASGRDLTMKTIDIINGALTEYEQENGRMLKRDDNGKIIQEVKIDFQEEEDKYSCIVSPV